MPGADNGGDPLCVLYRNTCFVARSAGRLSQACWRLILDRKLAIRAM